MQTAPKNLVRTDPKLQKLDKFLSSTPNPDISATGSGFHDTPSRIVPADTTGIPNSSIITNVPSPSKCDVSPKR